VRAEIRKRDDVTARHGAARLTKTDAKSPAVSRCRDARGSYIYLEHYICGPLLREIFETSSATGDKSSALVMSTSAFEREELLIATVSSGLTEVLP